jgi:hypothetical protein
VVAPQAGAATDTRETETLDEPAACGIELAADAVALQRRIDDRLRPYIVRPLTGSWLVNMPSAVKSSQQSKSS